MRTELDAARLLVFRAAWLADTVDRRTTREASTAKLFATEAAQRIVDRAVQLHGGRGVVKGVVGLGLPIVSMAILLNFLPPLTVLGLMVAPILITNMWQSLRPGTCCNPWAGSGR